MKRPNLSHWNHRVEHNKDGYAVVEAYYEGKKVKATAECTERFDSPEELKQDLLDLLGAFEHDIIEDNGTNTNSRESYRRNPGDRDTGSPE